MPRPVGQLGPLPEDLPTERADLARALRGLWVHFGAKTSVREYAGKQNLAPSSVSRYLKGELLPPETFVIDLVDAVELELGTSPPGEAERVLALVHAAQDAQSGTWGSGKRWRTRCLHEQHRAAALERENTTITEENRWLSERVATLERELATIQPLLDQIRPDNGRPSIALAHELAHWYLQGSTLSYWPFYARSLEAKGWADSAIAGLDAATTKVLGLLADPLSQQARATGGTVIHYPGSGHTSNVVGLIAKAVDLGYRMVIVLAGTQNVARRRMQQRLDDGLPSLPNTSGVIRLTDPDLDYRSLRSRLSELEFEKQRPDLPLNASENLRHAAVRLIVVKKNAAVLRKLCTDLLAIRTPLSEIPTLIVDVEAEPDQQGTAVARHIDRLVEFLPRAQHVAYASRPLPSDSYFVKSADNIQTTKDFVVSTPRPDNYVGAHHFYDPDDSEPVEHRDLATSGERAYVRRVDQGDHGLLEAMDMFVLSAAMKLHRDHRASLKRHTMLVQTSARRDAQAAMRQRLAMLWRSANYAEASTHQRLRALFGSDVLPISRARAQDTRLPVSFDELQPSIDRALARIGPLPVADEYDQPGQWIIIVSGPHATDETISDGLTVLFLDVDGRRGSKPQILDHWFGYRPGYTDLVRLYLPRPRNPVTEDDPYASLVSTWRTEEGRRADLHRSARTIDRL